MTITVTIDDDPGTTPAGASGSRDDGALSRSVKIKVVANGLSVTTAKGSICGGAKGYSDPNPHRTKVTATLTDPDGNPIANETIGFSVTGPSVSISPSISPSSATTDSNGQAEAQLLSGDKIGTATVKATYGTTEATADVGIAAPDGVASIDPEELVADGESTATLSSTWTFDLDPVQQHDIHWRISRIWDEEDTLIYDPDNGIDNRPTDSNFGNVSPIQMNTDPDGVAATTYTVGTSGGTIEFEASDNSLTVGSFGCARNSTVAKPLKFNITKPTSGQSCVLDNVNILNYVDFRGKLLNTAGQDITSGATKIEYKWTKTWYCDWRDSVGGPLRECTYSCSATVLENNPGSQSAMQVFLRGHKVTLYGKINYNSAWKNAANAPVKFTLIGQNPTRAQIIAVLPGGAGTSDLLTKALMFTESSWKQFSPDPGEPLKSYTPTGQLIGARGLMQVMPSWDGKSGIDYWIAAWNWRSNIAAGQTVYQYYLNIVLGYGYEGQDAENRALRAYNTGNETESGIRAANPESYPFVISIRSNMASPPW